MDTQSGPRKKANNAAVVRLFLLTGVDSGSAAVGMGYMFDGLVGLRFKVNVLSSHCRPRLALAMPPW